MKLENDDIELLRTIGKDNAPLPSGMTKRQFNASFRRLLKAGYVEEWETDDAGGFNVTDAGWAYLVALDKPKHVGFYAEVDGEAVHILGDPNMDKESFEALSNVIRAAKRAIERGDFD